MRRLAPTVVAATVLVSALGIYAFADAAGVVPGWLTDEPVASPPAPFPDALLPRPDTPVLPIDSLHSDAPIPAAAAVQALANSLSNDPRVRSSIGISVIDISSGTSLASVHSTDPQVPASNVKLLTALAVSETIEPERRLKTAVTWSSVDAFGSVRLTLVAGGDMLLAPEYGHGDTGSSADRYAGMGDLADAIVSALSSESVTRVDIVVDDHAFDGTTLPGGWDSDAVTMGYCAAPSGLAVDEAVIPHDNPDADPLRYPDPSLNAGQILATRLAERGISVGTVTRGEARPGETELASVESAPLDDVVAYMLWYSDNTIAEVLLKLVALEGGLPGTTKSGAAEALRVLAAAGLDTTGVKLTDGSGYSNTNRVSAQFLTDLIVLVARDPVRDDLLEELPIGALRGTLLDRFRDTQGAGVVRAKTGSLSGVTSLSGTVVTKDDRWLAFSVLADGLPWGQVKPRAAIDEFVAALAACGCG